MFGGDDNANSGFYTPYSIIDALIEIGFLALELALRGYITHIFVYLTHIDSNNPTLHAGLCMGHALDGDMKSALYNLDVGIEAFPKDEAMWAAYIYIHKLNRGLEGEAVALMKAQSVLDSETFENTAAMADELHSAAYENGASNFGLLLISGVWSVI